jgi:hypothetical protein
MPPSAPSSGSSRHQHKKPFQLPITSFFGRDTSDTVIDQADSIAPRQQQQQPSLAPTVQASLLSVGMRIRKAVPEGYKTHKTLLVNDEENIPPTAPYGSDLSSSRDQDSGRQRGLQPFCGIHQVGGLGVQETSWSAYEFGYRYQPDTADAFGSMADDGFPGSQESNASSVSTGSVRLPLGTGKRRYEEDADEEEFDTLEFGLMPLDQSFGGQQQQQAQQSFHRPMASRQRSYARPRARRTNSRQLSSGNGAGPMQTTISFGADDFDEASFLRPFGEIDMGGV